MIQSFDIFFVQYYRSFWLEQYMVWEKRPKICTKQDPPSPCHKRLQRVKYYKVIFQQKSSIFHQLMGKAVSKLLFTSSFLKFYTFLGQIHYLSSDRSIQNDNRTRQVPSPTVSANSWLINIRCTTNTQSLTRNLQWSNQQLAALNMWSWYSNILFIYQTNLQTPKGIAQNLCNSSIPLQSIQDNDPKFTPSKTHHLIFF